MSPIIWENMDLETIMLNKIKARHSKNQQALLCPMEIKGRRKPPQERRMKIRHDQ